MSSRAHGSGTSGHHHHVKVVHSLLDGVDLAKPLCSGYMFKQAHTHVVFHRRYFVLFPRVLVYYEKEADYHKDVARGKLERRHGGIRLEGLYLSKPDKKPKGGKYCFILHAPDKHNERHEFLLVTHTKEDRKLWVDKLQSQNSALLSPASPLQPIRADTPQPPRKFRADSQPSSESGDLGRRNESSNSLSSVPTTSVTPDQSRREHLVRPGSPRHDVSSARMITVASEDSICGMDHLDIKHLEISEGTSDIEEGW